MEFTLFYLVVMIFQLMLHNTCNTDANSIIAEPCLYPNKDNRATAKNKTQLHKTTLRLICLKSSTTGGGPNVKSDKVCNEERNRTLSEEGPVVLYIAIGLGSLALIVLLFVITIVIAKRKKSTFLLRDKTKQSKSSCQNVQREPDDELQDNILYVPTEAYADGKTNNEGNMVTSKEITIDVEGNYITMSFEETANARDKKNTEFNNTTETAPSKADSSVDASDDINTETSDEKHQSEEPEEATNAVNVYAVVNKTSKNPTLKENKASSVTSIICKKEHPPSFEDRDNWSKDKSKSDNAHANQRKIRYHSGVEGDYSSIDFDEETSHNDVTKSVINNGNDIIRAIENQKLKEGDDIERQEEQKPYIDVLLNQPTVVDREKPSNKHCDSDHVYSVVNKPFKKEQ